MKKAAFILMISFLCSPQSFAGDAHVECSSSNKNAARKIAAEKQVEGILRTSSSEVKDTSDAIDSDKDE